MEWLWAPHLLAFALIPCHAASPKCCRTPPGVWEQVWFWFMWGCSSDSPHRQAGTQQGASSELGFPTASSSGCCREGAMDTCSLPISASSSRPPMKGSAPTPGDGQVSNWSLLSPESGTTRWEGGKSLGALMKISSLQKSKNSETDKEQLSQLQF